MTTKMATRRMVSRSPVMSRCWPLGSSARRRSSSGRTRPFETMMASATDLPFRIVLDHRHVELARQQKDGHQAEERHCQPRHAVKVAGEDPVDLRIPLDALDEAADAPQHGERDEEADGQESGELDEG